MRSVRSLQWQKWARCVSQEVPVPSLGDSISDGTLVELNVVVGQAVVADEIVGVIETDKVSLDIRTPFSGTVTDLLVEVDDTVIVGQGIMNVDADVVATVESSAPAETAPPSTTVSAPPVPTTPVTAAAPTPPAVVAFPSPAVATNNHKRQPMIRFRHGDRAVIDADRFSLPSGSASSVQTPAGDEDFLALPFLHRRLQLTEEEMDMINMGGAGPNDVEVSMKYI